MNRRNGEKMRNVIQNLLRLALMITLLSCASHPTTLPEIHYEKESILINLRADSQLNFYQGMPHTLMLCIYQLREPNVYEQHAGSQEGLQKLLECNLFDASVTSAKRFIVKPGESQMLTLDRFEGTRHVATVCGYWEMRADRIMQIAEIPVLEKRKRWKVWQKTKSPGELNIQLRLGPQQILNFEVK